MTTQETVKANWHLLRHVRTFDENDPGLVLVQSLGYHYLEAGRFLGSYSFVMRPDDGIMPRFYEDDQHGSNDWNTEESRHHGNQGCWGPEFEDLKGLLTLQEAAVVANNLGYSMFAFEDHDTREVHAYDISLIFADDDTPSDAAMLEDCRNRIAANVLLHATRHAGVPGQDPKDFIFATGDSHVKYAEAVREVPGLQEILQGAVRWLLFDNEPSPIAEALTMMLDDGQQDALLQIYHNV